MSERLSAAEQDRLNDDNLPFRNNGKNRWSTQVMSERDSSLRPGGGSERR